MVEIFDDLNQTEWAKEPMAKQSFSVFSTARLRV